MTTFSIQMFALFHVNCLTFSHPSIFSLFLSLLLGLESTLIREPRESAWLAVATAKEEKAGAGRTSVGINVLTYFILDRFTGNRLTHITVLPVMELSTSLENEASTELAWRVTPPAATAPTLRSSREPCCRCKKDSTKRKLIYLKT